MERPFVQNTAAAGLFVIGVLSLIGAHLERSGALLSVATGCVTALAAISQPGKAE